MSSTLKIKEHPEQVKARKVKEKFINRLIPPVRADYDRQDRCQCEITGLGGVRQKLWG